MTLTVQIHSRLENMQGTKEKIFQKSYNLDSIAVVKQHTMCMVHAISQVGTQTGKNWETVDRQKYTKKPK